MSEMSPAEIKYTMRRIEDALARCEKIVSGLNAIVVTGGPGHEPLTNRMAIAERELGRVESDLSKTSIVVHDVAEIARENAQAINMLSSKMEAHSKSGSKWKDNLFVLAVVGVTAILNYVVATAVATGHS